MSRTLEWIEKLEMVTEACCNCGVVFAVTKGYQEERRKDHRLFYCPSGHGQHYNEKTAVQRIEELEKSNRTLNERVAYWKAEEEKERLKASAAKGQVTRLKNRAAAGVCACCNRTFQNLARHMAGKHPEFAEPQP